MYLSSQVIDDEQHTGLLALRNTHLAIHVCSALCVGGGANEGGVSEWVEFNAPPDTH